MEPLTDTVQCLGIILVDFQAFLCKFRAIEYRREERDAGLGQ